MDVFDLFARISLDTSDYERGLDEASGKSRNFGDVVKDAFGKIAKVGAAAMTTATAAVTAFAKASIDTGMQFDSAMSQVAATMGTTVDQIQNLRDFAMEMGSSTAFSANEAAEALNFMALAGYDADESMQALPNVLNLAAAGGIDLAAASDMVTDAQSALGLSMEESAELVDKMAMASSKSNTSVAQLGEAILTIGGTAKNMAGGTTELTTALGILADNGIKASEGGTALRNIMLSLSAPTDTAAKTMRALGLEVYDADGNMRPLNDTFSDLNAVLSTMTQGEQTEVLNTIFNKVDLKSVNALLATDAERWDELAGSIDNAAGAAEQMANTQLDNLSGDITLFKSALEGAQITISDQLTPSLREFVQFGSEGVSSLATAFQEGGLSGAMEAFGGILSEGIGMIMEQLPAAVDAGMQLLGAVGQGIIDNLPVITDAALQIIMMLSTGLISALPDIGSSAVEIITTLADGIAEQLPTLVPVAIDAILQLVDTLTDPDNLGNLLDSALAIIQSLADGLIEYIPKLREKAPEIVRNIVTFIIESAPKLLAAAAELITTLGVALVDYAVNLPGYIWDVITAIYDGFIDGVDRIKEAGSQLLTGLWNGITDKIDWLKGKVSGVVNTIKSWFTGKDGFDEHSPSKWSQGVSEFVMDGLAIGFKNREGKVLETVDDVANEIKTRLDDFLGDVEHAMFLAEKNGAATAADMVDAYRLMQEKVHEAAEWYRAQGYAETSDEIQKLQKLWWGYADNVAAAQLEAANAVIDSIKAQYESLSNFVGLKTDVSDLEYQLWERTEGKNVSDVEKYAKQLELLSVKQEGQQSIVEAAAAAYEAVVEQYGAASAESLSYQKTLLQEQLALQDLIDEINEVNAARLQAIRTGNIQSAQIAWENSGLGMASAAAINAGYANPYDIAMQANIQVVMPDGKVLAEAVADPLVDRMNANGTPIVNPKR